MQKEWDFVSLKGESMFPYVFGVFLGFFLVGVVGEIAVMARIFRQFREADDLVIFPRVFFFFAACALVGVVVAISAVVLRAFGYLI